MMINKKIENYVINSVIYAFAAKNTKKMISYTHEYDILEKSIDVDEFNILQRAIKFNDPDPIFMNFIVVRELVNMVETEAIKNPHMLMKFVNKNIKKFGMPLGAFQKSLLDKENKEKYKHINFDPSVYNIDRDKSHISNIIFSVIFIIIKTMSNVKSVTLHDYCSLDEDKFIWKVTRIAAQNIQFMKIANIMDELYNNLEKPDLQLSDVREFIKIADSQFEHHFPELCKSAGIVQTDEIREYISKLDDNVDLYTNL